MQVLPHNIKSIRGIKNIKLYLRYSEDLYLRQHYVVTDTFGKEYEYSPVIKPSRGLIIDYAIIDKNNFCNGFRLVKFSDESYGYIYQQGGYVDFHRYDIATNFNKYGIAMVAKYGTVSFIDTNFNYLQLTELDKEIFFKMVEEDTANYLDFKGIYEISKFSLGKAKVKAIHNNIEYEKSISKKLIKKR